MRYFFIQNLKRGALATFSGVSKPNMEDYSIFNQVCVFSSIILTTSSNIMVSTYFYGNLSMTRKLNKYNIPFLLWGSQIAVKYLDKNYQSLAMNPKHVVQFVELHIFFFFFFFSFSFSFKHMRQACLSSVFKYTNGKCDDCSVPHIF